MSRRSISSLSGSATSAPPLVNNAASTSRSITFKDSFNRFVAIILWLLLLVVFCLAAALPVQTIQQIAVWVAQMAGLSQQVVTRAHDILLTLEGKKKEIPTIPIPEVEKRINQPKDDGQLSIFEFRDDTIRDAIMAVNINSLTPLQALQALADLQKKVTDH